MEGTQSKTFMRKTINETFKARVMVLLTSLVCAGLNAQTQESFNDNAFLQPTAQSWQITHFSGNDPADGTGMMNETIPLFHYSDPDFDFPLSLCYSFGGYRPSQGSGTLGYGWTLGCGGAVTRIVRGAPDEQNGPYDDSMIYGYLHTDEVKFTQENTPAAYEGNMVLSSMWRSSEANADFDDALESLNPYSDFPCWRSYGESLLESFPDIFQLRAPGLSCSFILKGTHDGECVVIDSNVPYGELRINYLPGEHVIGDIYAPTVSVVTGDGYSYLFGGDIKNVEYTKMFSSLGDGGATHDATPTAFYLHSITAPNGRVLEISYTDAPHRAINAMKSYTPYRRGMYNGAKGTMPSLAFQVISVDWTPCVKDVSVDGHRILSMEYVECADEYAERCFHISGTSTFPGYMTAVFPFDGARRLSAITISSADGVEVDRISIGHYQSVVETTPRLFLTSVSSRINGTYDFDYTGNYQFGRRDMEGTDHWGFANGSYVTDIREHLIMLRTAPSSLYQQVADSIKDPSFAHGVKCALDRITYPTGGSTLISYEPHIVSMRRDRCVGILPGAMNCSPMEVGGVRVRSITDITESGDSLTRTYTYNNSTDDSVSSGQLNMMPRYILPSSFFYNRMTVDIHQDDNIILESYAYSGEMNSGVLSEPVVSYGSIQTHYPDGSVTEKRYVTDRERPDLYDVYDPIQGVDEDTDFEIFQKKCYGDHDFISGELDFRGYLRFLSPPVTDRSLLRGKILYERRLDSEGMPVYEADYHYDERICVTKDILINLVMWNYRMAQGISSSQLREVAETTYEGGHVYTLRNETYYNNLGQTVSRQTADLQTGLSNTVLTSYCHEFTFPAESRLSPLPSAVHSMVYLRGSVETDRNIFYYDQDSVNPSPCMITRTRGGVSRTTTIQYDTHFRPVRIENPGGRWKEFRWSSDGRHLLSVTGDDVSNNTSYTWQDLVGLSSVSLPSGQSESYTYDSKGRLSERRDTDGETTLSYEYNLVNEE